MSIDTSILTEAHQRMLLVESAISEGIILARGYRTETVKANLLRLGFSNRQARVPALLTRRLYTQDNVRATGNPATKPRTRTRRTQSGAPSVWVTRRAISVNPYAIAIYSSPVRITRRCCNSCNQPSGVDVG